MTQNSDQREARREYAHNELRRKDLADDPQEQFSKWLDDAVAAELIDATAMALATADGNGRPSNRIVLLKQFDQHGFMFFTDYRSRKGDELRANPQAEALFYWRELERQVRIRGAIIPADRDVAAGYFSSRPRESQVSAAVSKQSAEIDSRDTLVNRADSMAARYEGVDIPVPQDWGGYMLTPDEYEFWQGRTGRLHDRFRYAKSNTGTWTIARLQP